MLRDLEGAVYTALALFFAPPVFAAETQFVQILVGVTQLLVLIIAATEAIDTEETFVLEAVDLVFRVQADRNVDVTTTLSSLMGTMKKTPNTENFIFGS